MESWKGGTCPLGEGFTQGSQWEKTVCVLRATKPTQTHSVENIKTLPTKQGRGHRPLMMMVDVQVDAIILALSPEVEHVNL